MPLIDATTGFYKPPATHPEIPASQSSGDGSPEGIVIGYPGQPYWDATNNILYIKDTGVGTTTGWVESGGSGGGGGLSGSGNPEGVFEAEPGTPYWDTTNKVFYVKDTGSGDTGWRELIA